MKSEEEDEDTKTGIPGKIFSENYGWHGAAAVANEFADGESDPDVKEVLKSQDRSGIQVSTIWRLSRMLIILALQLLFWM